MTAILCFLMGVLLLSLGVIGKIYLETKRRPRYIIAEKTAKKTDENEDSLYV